MIKAAAGGGGKGMRIVKDSASLKDAALQQKRKHYLDLEMTEYF
ncbi:MAG: hypothetical protein CM15mP104_3570 [Gammaproteobacteria bacterium]|nr:MAG: hypothetical protein CM15mP104_3570 [Gammaproteobacteria bacterium]